MTNEKFRISLDLNQIEWILANCQEALPSLHKQLTLLKTKADLGYTKPSYIIKPAIQKHKELPIEVRYKLATHALQRGEQLSPEQQSAYDEFRYLNDLMAEDEAESYEAASGF